VKHVRIHRPNFILGQGDTCRHVLVWVVGDEVLAVAGEPLIQKTGK
jgi:hypothetical protein